MTIQHPEFAQEQQYVEHAYDLLDRGLAEAEQNIVNFEALHRSTAHALNRALAILQNSRGSGQLVFGRMDRDDDKLYIGRRRVYDEERNLVVVGWHAPAAAAFYEATPQDPGDLILKRVFIEQDRRLQRVVDEVVRESAHSIATSEGDATISDALLQELDRSRDGAMREVVATIQSEQYRVIRHQSDGVVVVQGGPGTGKTVVGLHRAAWLAFNRPDIRRLGMLVVAPSSTLLTYFSGVLPSLDVSDIDQMDLDSLYGGEARITATDPVETARVKGSAAMSVVLERALRQRIGWDEDELVLPLGADRIRIQGDEIRQIVDDVRGRDLPHNEARDVLRQAMSALAAKHHSEDQRLQNRPVRANEATIRRLSAFSNALDRMWPTFAPEEFIRSLYSTQSWLTTSADGVLTADERARLFRSALDGEAWTRADLFCLDEISYLLNGEVMTYGHIVLDEAQDLSPMEARALARRCPSGSFTVLGDLAQATGVWVRDSWEELTQHLAVTDTSVNTLTIGYRVPAPALDLAARQLALISPDLRPPLSIRPGRSNPQFWQTSDEDLIGDALVLAKRYRDEGLTSALIVPDTLYDRLLAVAADDQIKLGDGRDGDFALETTAVPASLCKGLEFDVVILVEPALIAAQSVQGARQLYVAMTRCTQQLDIIHSELLPPGLGDLSEIDEVEEIDASSPTLSELLALLAEEDLALVEGLVRRLVLPVEPGTKDVAPSNEEPVR
ncbi:ATP-binding domain-containing protein [Streptomyces sp. SID13031]|uniref:HelD family protein n=1 Tax=Streptomyces sp. SID13031 TaxID=2706046 RepID=UPI0013C74158|nr:ATP-binding domain-containing protein [Streptomyces sp. SID13031]NEA30121.1 ATP-binding domain-containing protein [Streptomyces sp. SID13031]